MEEKYLKLLRYYSSTYKGNSIPIKWVYSDNQFTILQRVKFFLLIFKGIKYIQIR